MASLPDVVKRGGDLVLPWVSWYMMLLVPLLLFCSSLYIPPTVISDSAVGLFALRRMLDGEAFNTITTPNPANIAHDVITFLTWWSPGQYLTPGVFIWLGSNYGVALSLTTLLASVIGIVGWSRLPGVFP